MNRTLDWMEKHVWIANLATFVLVFALLLQVAIWAVDRDPPFRVLSYVTSDAQPGKVLEIAAQVQRDTKRDCSVELTSHFYDSVHTRFSAGDEGTLVSPDGIRAIESMSPGLLLRKISLPENIAVGPASLISTMQYRCNPLQDLMRPIEVQTEFKFTVLP